MQYTGSLLTDIAENAGGYDLNPSHYHFNYSTGFVAITQRKLQINYVFLTFSYLNHRVIEFTITD